MISDFILLQQSYFGNTDGIICRNYETTFNTAEEIVKIASMKLLLYKIKVDSK
ncbi:hypothetical protein FACS1894179_00940 [Bacteroidia bacterium]|nr:hypothetical protein FACS1894169_08030 [Bacteroidia bacterium]GHV38119.1 hypothetical protein FACS1894179_00940 [Bacteroidia bacterium]